MASVSIAADSEDRLQLLRALRTKLAWAVDTATCTRDIEPLARRLQAVAAEIAELAPTEAECRADQIAERRRARRRQA